MNQTSAPSNLSHSTLAHVAASDKHCIVRSGASWYSMAADSVREITIAPELVAVPRCHRSLAGLCHLRSEFIPVISLAALLDVDDRQDRDQKHSATRDKLMVIHGNSLWAMQISEAAAIESIETLVSPETRLDDVSQSPIIGTAMFRDQIVRVLDSNAVFRLAQQALEGFWRR